MNERVNGRKTCGEIKRKIEEERKPATLFPLTVDDVGKARHKRHMCVSPSLLLIHLGGCVVKVKECRHFSFFAFTSCDATPLNEPSCSTPQIGQLLHLFCTYLILLAAFVGISIQSRRPPLAVANIDIKKSHHVA